MALRLCDSATLSDYKEKENPRSWYQERGSREIYNVTLSASFSDIKLSFCIISTKLHHSDRIVALYSFCVKGFPVTSLYNSIISVLFKVL